MGAHEDHISAHHADDHKSGDIGVKEFGWYLADCAGLADYNDGSMAGFTPEAYAKAMAATIHEVDAAVDYVHERQKNNDNQLHVEDEFRAKYQSYLQGHRKKVTELFKACDEDNSGTLDLNELRDIIKEVEGKEFDDKVFMAFFKGKGPDDSLSRLEFGYYVAHQAGSNDKVAGFIDKMSAVRQKVQDDWKVERKLGKRA